MSPPEKRSQFASPQGVVFATTHWSAIVRAGDSQSPEAALALERLCQAYWYPLYAFVRRKGHSHEDACDLTQEYFARLLEKGYLKAADANRGKFRTFLLTSLSNFLANEWNRLKTQRRGGGAPVLSLDDALADERYRLEPATHETPETLFNRRWAQTMMAEVLNLLEVEMEEKRFGVLKGFLLEDKGTISYEEAANQLGISVAALTSAIHRMRGRFRVLLYEAVAHTVGGPEEVDLELHHLMAALSD